MNPDNRLRAFGVVLAVVILAGWVAYNVTFYQDWRCAFSRCVRVENVRL